jgi:hypothetical protein
MASKISVALRRAGKIKNFLSKNGYHYIQYGTGVLHIKFENNQTMCGQNFGTGKDAEVQDNSKICQTCLLATQSGRLTRLKQKWAEGVGNSDGNKPW